MASEDTGLGGLAGRYALALLDLADEKKLLDEVAGDLRTLKGVIGESDDLKKLLGSPLLSRSDQAKAMAAVLTHIGAQDLTGRFVQVVARNRRLFVLPRMIDAYLGELARRRGEVTAQVTSAYALSDSQREALITTLKNAIGTKVKVDLTVDPSLIGGLVVKVGSRMIDSSLKSKLSRLQLAMKGVG